MNELERKMIRCVCEEAYTNKDENPYEIYVNLGDCYKSFSKAKEEAYYNCISAFSGDVRYFEELAKRSFITFTRILSHNTMMFTLLQGAYYFAKDGSLIGLVRYDSKTKAILRGFKMSKDGLEMKKYVNDIRQLIIANKD